MPSDLLHLVFAHLPVDEISHLRVLNKEWMQIMSKPDSEFYRHCDAVQPKMMCVLAKDSLTSNKFWVRVCDLKRGTWRRYEIIVGYPEYLIWTLACEDEGLVCFVTHVNFVSWKRDESPTIFLNVVNPLKIVLYELPPLVNMRGSIFQMKVDTTTKEFQVFVVAKRSQWSGSMWSEYHGEFTMQIFDSVTKEWSQWTPAQVFPDIVSGRLRDKQTFAIYDCANRRFVDLKAGDSSPWRGQFVGSAFYQDRIFMLRRGNDGPPNFDAGANGNKVIFYIEEWQYCQVRGDRSWLKIDVHRCNPFERPPKNPVQYFMRLFTCKGLLMVIAELTPFHAQGRFTNKRLVWLYDLSTRTWSALDLPRLPAEIKRAYPMDPYDPTHSVQLICEPRWTV